MRCSPSVLWRLPTRDDYLTAYLNGGGYVMNAFRDGSTYWTASVYSKYRQYAWYFYAYDVGYLHLDYGIRFFPFTVRCVGR